MFMLNITLTFIGIAFFMFGFLVSFKKKYNLVYVFTRAKDDSYAEQIGLISLMSGMLYIFAGIVGLVCTNVIFSIFLFVACVSITSSLLVVSTLKSRGV